MNTINLPQLVQTYNYDCGAKALQSILAYYGIEAREDKIMKFAKTSKKGTPIRGMVTATEKFGLKTEIKGMTIKDIKEYIKKDIPVILILQAWTGKKEVDWEKDWADGHYVVAIGYTKDKVLFVDPSSFQYTYLKYNELEKRWHDVDTDGKKYDHYGIAIFGKKPKFKKCKMVHMD